MAAIPLESTRWLPGPEGEDPVDGAGAAVGAAVGEGLGLPGVEGAMVVGVGEGLGLADAVEAVGVGLGEGVCPAAEAGTTATTTCATATTTERHVSLLRFDVLIPVISNP